MEEEKYDQEGSSENLGQPEEGVVEDSGPVNYNTINVPTLAELKAKGKSAEILLWVGCAGAYDDRYQKVTQDLVRILSHLNISYGVLGIEESCTGDPAKRAGNEFIYQMQAMKNIETLNSYGVKKVLTACPHCFNIIKNEYPELGGSYEVLHHSVFLQQLINAGRLKINGGGEFKGKTITFHDSCYLGRGNDIYEAPRSVIQALDVNLIEMKRNKSKGLCCGAGGAQMFKDAEPGNKEVNIERSEEALETNPDVIATACPFCMTMLVDGVKHHNKEHEVKVLDLAELVAKSNNL
ncbi:MAG TPA: (Fe-S)-binding protein [Flavobacteriales bacterium]|nr:(Fe-S)-binding protein [Flavobacteriales bacterium]HIN40454.1 (Fe-S)-binding protein [Flavobacteriales bacterium]